VIYIFINDLKGGSSMKRGLLSLLILVLAFSMVLAGCGESKKDNTAKEPAESKQEDPVAETEKDAEPAKDSEGAVAVEERKVSVPTDTAGEVNLWTFGEFGFNEIAALFNKEYPNIKINVTVMDFMEMHDKLHTTLGAGTGAPDIVVIEGGQFGRYNSLGVLEDLSKPPYNADKYKADTSRYNWERWLSVDGKNLVAMPWDITPGVAYYRADIFEELGFPSDPEELAVYMEDPDQFISMAQTFKANGKVLFEWKDQAVQWFAGTKGYYDRDLKWTRNTDEIAKFLDISKKVTQLELAAGLSYWSEEGAQMVNNGTLPFVVFGSWGERPLKERHPDLAGKWRVTRLPLGMYGGMGGSGFAIPSQSQNKLAAWAFTEFAMINEEAWKVFNKQSIQPGWKFMSSKPWYEEQESEYLGGQKPYKLYNSIVDKIEPINYTPLDGQAWPIWLEGILETVDKNLDSKAALQKIQENVEKALAADKEKLLQSMNK
jgi:multiple sugar transport system substrate-binding protein